jgi:D-sedoheptulose 7-phosphate isomerase
MKPLVESFFNELFIRYPQLERCRKSIKEAFFILMECYKSDGKILICGNGGSAADSEHIVGELMKGFLLKRPIKEKEKEKIRAAFPEDWEYLSEHLQGAIPAISLISQSAISTAYVNDIAADMVYAQQVYGYAKSGDVLIGLSTSGNSRNVVNAIKVATAFGIKTIGMTGKSGGLIKELCDVNIQVPEVETYKIQEYHLPVYHTLCAMIESEVFNL